VRFRAIQVSLGFSQALKALSLERCLPGVTYCGFHFALAMGSRIRQGRATVP